MTSLIISPFTCYRTLPISEIVTPSPVSLQSSSPPPRLPSIHADLWPSAPASARSRSARSRSLVPRRSPNRVVDRVLCLARSASTLCFSHVPRVGGSPRPIGRGARSSQARPTRFFLRSVLPFRPSPEKTIDLGVSPGAPEQSPSQLSLIPSTAIGLLKKENVCTF